MGLFERQLFCLCGDLTKSSHLPLREWTFSSLQFGLHRHETPALLALLGCLNKFRTSETDSITTGLLVAFCVILLVEEVPRCRLLQ